MASPEKQARRSTRSTANKAVDYNESTKTNAEPPPPSVRKVRVVKKTPKLSPTVSEDESMSTVMSSSCSVATPAAELDPVRLVGRRTQLTQLEESIGGALDGGTALCLYLSGAPGTGKTASVHYTLRQLAHKRVAFHQVVINCMDVRTPTSLYKRVLDELYAKDAALATMAPNGMRVEQRLRYILTHCRVMIVILLDEIDQLATSNYAVLYAAFGWPALDGSKVILIGIANSLDLTERLLPKLALNTACEPTLLKYNAYTTQEVIDIVTDKMTQSNAQLGVKAIELCARKVCAITGDIRKALGLCALAIEKMNAGGGAERVTTVRHVLQSVNDVYGSKSKQACSHLPLHSKLILVSAIRMAQNGDATMLLTNLYAMYTRACALSKCERLPLSDVVASCDILDAHAILSIQTGGGKGGTPSRGVRKSAGVNENKQRYIRLLMDIEGAQMALNDEVIVKQVLLLL